MSTTIHKSRFNQRFYDGFIKKTKMSFFKKTIDKMASEVNFSSVRTEDPILWLEHNFIFTFNYFLKEMNNFGYLLAKFHNEGAPNHLLAFRKFMPSAGSIQFPLLVKRFTDLGFDTKTICPPFSKEEVLVSDKDMKNKYCKNYNYDWFGTGKPNLVHIAKAAILTTKQFFSGVVFKPISLTEVLDIILAKNTASGIPFFIKKKDLDKDFMFNYITKFIKDFSYTKIFDFGTIIAHRFQVRRIDDDDNFAVKARCVFVVSIVFLVLQAYIFAPLIIAFKDHSEQSRFYTNYVDPIQLSRGFAKLRRKSQGSTLSNVDFSKFDTSIRPFIKLSFFICMFPFASIQAVLFPSFTQFVLLYWTLALFSIFNPTYWDNSKAVITSGSTISGEYITSFFNTWVHVFAINYYSITHNIKIDIDSEDPDILVQGDDGVYRDDIINLNDFKISCKQLDLNVDEFSSRSFKWDSNKAHFLGRYFDKFCRPYQTRNWYISHSYNVNQYNPNISFSELMTIRHYGLALPHNNANFAISLFAKVDTHIFEDLYAFVADSNHKVVVKDNEGILYRLQFIEIYGDGRFIKYNEDIF